MAARGRKRGKPARVGCSGWVYKDWRGRLYPEQLPQRLWLQRYAEVFDTVEINNTFYRLPTRSAVEGWVRHTPGSFVFTVKGSRYLTHIKRLRWDDPKYLGRFYEPLEPMIEAGKLGPVLWQFPASFQRDTGRLAAALERLPDGRHCFEFRHESWFAEPVYALLREHGAALVIGDDPERSFQSRVRTAGWTLVRFHRGSRGRTGRYSGPELQTWARRLAQWRRETELFAYFNNDRRGHAVENALDLKGRLGV